MPSLIQNMGQFPDHSALEPIPLVRLQYFLLSGVGLGGVHPLGR